MALSTHEAAARRVGSTLVGGAPGDVEAITVKRSRINPVSKKRAALNRVWLCRPCHEHITTHPWWAAENGWSLSSYGGSA